MAFPEDVTATLVSLLKLLSLDALDLVAIVTEILHDIKEDVDSCCIVCKCLFGSVDSASPQLQGLLTEFVSSNLENKAAIEALGMYSLLNKQVAADSLHLFQSHPKVCPFQLVDPI